MGDLIEFDDGLVICMIFLVVAETPDADMADILNNKLLLNDPEESLLDEDTMAGLKDRLQNEAPLQWETISKLVKRDGKGAIQDYVEYIHSEELLDHFPPRDSHICTKSLEAAKNKLNKDVLRQVYGRNCHLEYDRDSQMFVERDP